MAMPERWRDTRSPEGALWSQQPAMNSTLRTLGGFVACQPVDQELRRRHL